MESFNSKVLLFGEYSVLYNSMALVVPCDKYHGQLSLNMCSTNDKYALQSNEFLRRFSYFIASHLPEDFVLEVKRFEREIENGMFFQSTIPQGYGLGSSGALVVAIFSRYLWKAKEFKDGLKDISKEKLEQLKSVLGEMESFFHGVSSGLDPLSIILNKPILFKNAKDIETAVLPKRNDEGKNVVFLLNTHIQRNTSNLMKRFNTMKNDKKYDVKLNEELPHYANESIKSFLKSNPELLYENVHNLSRFQLDNMPDFIPESLHKIVRRGFESGDYFLKLCGAGGGGFMLGFTENWQQAQSDLKNYELDVIYRF